MHKFLKILVFINLYLFAKSPIVIQENNGLKINFFVKYSLDSLKNISFNGYYLSESNGNSIKLYTTYSIATPSVNRPLYQIVELKKEFVAGRLKYFNKNIAVNSEKNIIEYLNIDRVRDNYIATYNFNPIFYDSLNDRTIIVKQILVNYYFPNVLTNDDSYDDELIKSLVLNYDQSKRMRIKDIRLKKNSISIFANNKYYRFKLTEEGIYKITADKLADFGIEKSKVDPRTIKIYTYGGSSLSENLTNTPYEPIEIPLYVVGEEDGKFDDNDYILFYGRGVNFWQPDTMGNVARNRNYYANETYYIITYGGNFGKRISKIQSVNNSNVLNVENTKAYTFIEEDKYNLASTGREFYGDEFNDLTTNKIYSINTSGIIANTNLNLKVNFVNSLEISNYEKMRIMWNDNLFGESTFLYGVVQDYYYGAPYTLNFSGNIGLNTKVNNNLQIKLLPGKNSVRGYLNYVVIEYTRSLNVDNDKLFVFTKDTTGLLLYHLTNFSNSLIKLFDITDIYNVKEIIPLMISGGEVIFTVENITKKVKKILCLTTDKYLNVPKGEIITFKDLKSDLIGAKYIIITHKNFKQQAERLKEFKQNESRFPISTKVVDIEDILNEFSLGSNDPTAIRNYLKWSYENCSIKPEYVLFFGDCTYDFRNIENKGNNFVPTYQTEYSLDIINSWATDDYFCNVVGDDKINTMRIDIIPGRVPCRTESEAKNFVDKIIQYDKKIIPGQWKNTITLVADDHYRPGNPDDGGSEFEFTYQSDNIAENILPPIFNINKLYSIRYPFENTSLGRRRPAVNQAIIDAVNNGTLILNYIGHGSPDLWADEQIFDVEISLPKFNNDKLFFLCAATCDFGYFDLMEKQSAAEKMLLRENNGMVSGFAFNRPVFGTDNATILYYLFDSLFKFNKNDSIKGYADFNRATGLAVYKLKQIKTGFATQKLIYFGDPTLVLQVPRYYLKIDSINGISTNQNIQLKALQKVKINATTYTTNDGVATIDFYDSYKLEYVKPLNSYIKDKGGLIYRGKVSINNFKIQDGFIIPKDISYSGKQGKILVYYYNENENIDGIGYYDKVIVNGIDTSVVVDDKKGPNIEIFFDNVNNKNVKLVNTNAKLLVKLSDENGINTTGLGLGHKLEAIFNDDEKNAIDLSQYFVSDINSNGKSGIIEYTLSNLKKGKNKLKIKAWDIYNNYSEEETYFTVVDENNSYISEVYNYPNPFSNYTYFIFEHNIQSLVNVEIKIYSVSGRLIKTINENGISDRYIKIFWDGKDEEMNNIGNGIYFYKIKLKDIIRNLTVEKIGKLAIIK